MRKGVLIIRALAITVLLNSCSQSQKWSEEIHQKYIVLRQPEGKDIAYSPESGVNLLYDKGFAFKDLNRNGVLDVYEDWREPFEKRSEDLASQLSLDEIAGLMLYSIHQAVPVDSVGYWSSTFNGTTLNRSGLPHSAISDKQKIFLKEDNLRAILVVRVESPRIAAEWNNNIQAYSEALPHGIPVNISSDPRNETTAWAEFNAGAGGKISLWPNALGLAATFDPELVYRFGQVASKEYRCLGIATALSPQVDLATEPRWNRFSGTFGENPVLSADMAAAYVDGFQTSEGEDEIKDGWGYSSVNCMVKHWPGGGPEEGGRDAHYSYGKYTVYPGDNLSEQLVPFVEGAFRLKGKTGKASAVMPYYTISYGQNPSGENVGNAYSHYLVGELLRDKFDYDQVVCTDWGVTHDYCKVEEADGKCWGVEHLSEGERHYKAICAGVDQFGGNNVKGPVLEAYRKYVEEHGEAAARTRFELSAKRLLMNMFRTGLFDNPYVDPEEAERLVGCPEFMEEGYAAQLKSVVLLKNRNYMVEENSKVFLPRESILDKSMVSKYFRIVGNPDDADFALCCIDAPKSEEGYSVDDRENGGNGYLPISLQYRPYTALTSRDVSLAGGDPLETSADRSYKGKTVKTENEAELDQVIGVKKLMGDKPVVVAISANRPFVPAEVEPYADVLLVTFGVQYQVVMDVLRGAFEPCGLLPMQLPADMHTVESQLEDVPLDMTPYKDSEGNTYDFAFGLDWSGRILDGRYRKYSEKLVVSQVDALKKVLPDTELAELKGNDFRCEDTLRVAIGESAEFQLVIDAKSTVVSPEIKMDVKHLKPEIGWVHNVRSSHQYSPADPESLVSRTGLYPDPIVRSAPDTLFEGQRAIVYIDIPISEKSAPGVYEGNITVSDESQILGSSKVCIKVYPVKIPENQSLSVLNWTFTEKFPFMNNGQPVGKFSKDYWTCYKSLIKTAAAHGQNVWLVEEFGEPVIRRGKLSFDFSKMDATIDFLLDNVPVKLLVGNHLAKRSNNGWCDPFWAKIPIVNDDGGIRTERLPYDDPRVAQYFDSYFKALESHLRSKGMADGRTWFDIYSQHIADEPVRENIGSWEGLASLVKAASPELKILEAYRTDRFDPELIDIIVPQLDELCWQCYDGLLSKESSGSTECWFYTCMYPRSTYANRYVSQPLIKTRLLHWINYKYNASGYLHWGFNFWGENGDPYGDVSAPLNDWPGGDSHIVYPDYLSVNPSIRLKAMRGGIKDYDLLKLAGQKNKELTRKIVGRIVNSYDSYDLDIADFREARRLLLEIASRE